MVSSRATRDAYGDALVQLGASRPDVLVCESDLARSTRTEWFWKAYPDRFLNFGIAEANMIGAASGLALSGWTPFVTTYAIFIGRAYDQIRQAVAFPATNVKIVATHAGFAAGADGGSHQGIEDLALMRVLPGMTILSPADYDEAVSAVHAAAAHTGPVYLRLGKQDVPCLPFANHEFHIGEIRQLRDGEDVTIAATGVLVGEALMAAEQLEDAGLSARVLNVATIKPLDEAPLLEAARDTGCLVVAEEHSRIGGLASAVAELLSRRMPVPVVPVAVDDRFGRTGAWRELLDLHHLNAAGIAAGAREALELKAAGRAATR